jgi:hypothetical protein
MADHTQFLSTPPAVLVVRHVRFTAAGETVAEDPNNLVRHLVRFAPHIPRTRQARAEIAFRVQLSVEALKLAPADEAIMVPAYRQGLPRYAYVRPRFEPGGADIDTVEVNGADLTDTLGYAELWAVPPTPEDAPALRTPAVPL